jgi:hypothetical protein
VRETSDWKKAVKAFDQRYLSEFSNGERRKAIARIVTAYLSHDKVAASGVRDVLETVKIATTDLDNPQDISVQHTFKPFDYS